MITAIVSNNGFESFMQFLYVMIIFIAVLAIAYFVTKWIAKAQGGQYSKGNIELLEASRLNSNHYIQIVRIGKKIYALAVSKDTVTTIDELAEEDLELCKAETKNQTFSFAEILDKVKKDKQTK